MNNNYPFERRILHSIFQIVFVVTSGIYISWWITAPAVNSVLRNQPQPLSEHWLWGAIFLFDLGFLVICTYLCIEESIQMMTRFTDEGITQPSFPRSKLIRWQDVQTIRGLSTNTIRILTSTTQISLNLISFRNPQDFIDELKVRVPTSALPSTDELALENMRSTWMRIGLGSVGFLVFSILLFYSGNRTGSLLSGIMAIIFGFYFVQTWRRLSRPK